MIEQRELTNQVDMETLRAWLDSRRPITVVDVRGDDDRAQWAIPGSVHVNAYEALRGQPGALAHVDLPRDRPVVTVCNAGRVSQRPGITMHTASLLLQHALESSVQHSRQNG